MNTGIQRVGGLRPSAAVARGPAFSATEPHLISRRFLRIVGILPVAISLWPAVAPAQASSGRAASAKPHLTASINARTIYPGQKVEIAGALRPASDSGRVYLERRDGRRWSRIAATTARGTSKFAFGVKPRSAGVTFFRVYRPATRHFAAALSPSLRLFVYYTHYLSEVQPVTEQPYGPFVGPVELNGVSYSKSLSDDQLGGCDTRETWGYNLSRSATRFKAVVGMDDNSPSDTGVTFTVITDGVTRANAGPLSIGHPVAIDLDVTGTLRLELQSTLIEGDFGACSYDGRAAWGNALYFASK